MLRLYGKIGIMYTNPIRGGVPVKVTIYQEPCWLLEAAELVYGLVNQIPVEKLAGSGPYCIPPDQVRRIQAEVCAGLNPLDEVIQFYFRGVPLEGVPDRLSCLGCTLLYSFLEIDHPQPEEYVHALEADWHSLCQYGFHVEGINGFSLSFDPAPAGKLFSLAREMEDLRIPSLYRMQLLEVFSNFNRHVEQVVEVLRPVASMLPHYLAPWTRQIPDLAEQWNAYFQGNSAKEFFLRRAQIQNCEFLELKLAFRFFSTYGSPGKFLGEERRLLFHMGVNMEPGLGNAGQAQAPEEWELTALRLMANVSRMEMLRAMAERPMSGQELAQKLNLNSGSVFRDLNSLYNARLLLMESSGGRNCYRTNLPVVRNMMERMLGYLQNQG